MTTPRYLPPSTGYREHESLHWKEIVQASIIGAGGLIALWLFFAL